jgi:ssRNA-specific RNase YbeY (16S rRNA maturation enzyme)
LSNKENESKWNQLFFWEIFCLAHGMLGEINWNEINKKEIKKKKHLSSATRFFFFHSILHLHGM